MKATARIFCLLIAAALALTVLATCKPPADDDDGDPDEWVDDGEWVYDFMADGDAVLESGSGWYVDGGYTGQAPEGWWMGRTSVAAPYLFTGDFTAEFEFYLKYFSTEDNIYRFAFRLVDPNWETASEKYCSLAAYYTAFPVDGDAYYTVSQGNGHYSYVDRAGNIPGVTSGVNTCTLTRSGSTVTMSMNGTLVDTITIEAVNEPPLGYAPLVHGHNSTDEAETNFYIRKLTVTYTPGEVVEHDWNE